MNIEWSAFVLGFSAAAVIVGGIFLWIFNALADRIGARAKALTDDGEALRLAVKLRMRVNVAGNLVSVVYYTAVGADSVQELFGDDPAAATRRAIVRAAAAMSEGGEHE